MQLLKEFEDKLAAPRFKVFLDMDGVFADFDKGFKDLSGKTPEEFKQEQSGNAMWKLIHSQEQLNSGFFANLPKMPGADELMSGVKDLTGDNAIFLTAAGSKNTESVTNQKKEWIQRNYPGMDSIMVESGKDKAQYVIPNVASILIDDRMKAIGPWRDNGGYGILYKTHKQALDELNRIISQL